MGPGNGFPAQKQKGRREPPLACLSSVAAPAALLFACYVESAGPRTDIRLRIRPVTGIQWALDIASALSRGAVSRPRLQRRRCNGSRRHPEIAESILHTRESPFSRENRDLLPGYVPLPCRARGRVCCRVGAR